MLKTDTERFEDLCQKHGLPCYDLDAAVDAAEGRFEEARSVFDEVRRLRARLET